MCYSVSALSTSLPLLEQGNYSCRDRDSIATQQFLRFFPPPNHLTAMPPQHPLPPLSYSTLGIHPSDALSTIDRAFAAGFKSIVVFPSASNEQEIGAALSTIPRSTFYITVHVHPADSGPADACGSVTVFSIGGALRLPS